MFRNRRLIIATKHKKEAVIAPILEEKLGVTCFVDEEFDTDSFGTFSGEIEREKDALETIRMKCLVAMEKNNCDFAVASEGSFGPHPSLYFANADDELIMLIDKKNNLEIIAREISLETNFNAKLIRNKAELFDFTKTVLFPSHALIIKKDQNDHSFLRKGIKEETLLVEYVEYCIKTFGHAYIETDMRAMHNPTRMKVIESAMKKLILNIESVCPKCSNPGFVISDVISGLPCELCNFPTDSTLFHKYTCASCEFEEKKKFPHGKELEDPMYCNRCNP
ncbi:MAG: hypothetical protein FJZ67_01180 [Bacteroidetes bacterium]|nr:hypothetical protein [Bacteroidota bacterium]